MAYWREYKNKYGAVINHMLVYTASDKEKQRNRTYNRATKVYPRMYRTKYRVKSIRYFFRSGDPENFMLDTLQDRQTELECKRAQLGLTRAILANKRQWGDTVRTLRGITVGIHLSGNLDVIREAIYQLEYDIKYLQWVIRGYNKKLLGV